MKRIATTFVFAVILFSSVWSVQAKDTFISIGTGGITGVYYPAGGAICRLMNKNRRDTGIRCSVESTGGSIYNINTIREGELEFGTVQSDWQYHAYNGTSKFSDMGPFKDLRAVFSLHPEPFTVVARLDSKIKNFDDLRGKRVNVGDIGSGTRATLEVLLAEKGWTFDDFSLTSELKVSEQAQALCDNKVDAIIYTVGHPSGSIQEAMSSCESVLVNVEGPSVRKLISDNPYYRSAIIPANMYPSSKQDVEVFGVGATIVTSANVPDEVVYQLVRSVFENFENFRKLHPAFKHLDKKKMITDALSAPLHPGAARYYREAGLL